MKNLKDYKEVIHKCSKCGLCQSVCPPYLETGNECAVSRGQFIMLRGVINGDLKINKNINKYLDICLKCGKCSSFCPSDIDIVEVILAAKAEYFKKSFNSKFLSFLHSKLIFNTILSFARLLFGKQKKFNKTFDKKAIYFGGCIETITPKTSEYIKELLNQMNIEVVNKNFNCCGLPFLTSGNMKRFVQQMEENLKKIENINFDYFVTDCASCDYTWKKYIDYVEDEKLKHKLQEIKFISIYDLILENNIQFESKEYCSLTYHIPCHGGSEDIINSISNIEYKELRGKNDCCGFSSLIKPATWSTSRKIIDKKRKNIIETHTDYVLTSCVGCILSLLVILGFKKKVVRLIDFLRTNCVVKK